MHSLAGSGETSFLRSAKMGPRINARRFVQIFLVSVPLAYLVSTSATATDVPEVKADIGPCSAEFTILDKSGKPIYDAKIRVTVRYGFMEKRKQDLEIGTNSDGKARVTGLPIKLKRPLEYKISFAQMTKSVMSDPGVECHDKVTVTLGSP
jgi:hypothetical protein